MALIPSISNLILRSQSPPPSNLIKNLHPIICIHALSPQETSFQNSNSHSKKRFVAACDQALKRHEQLTNSAKNKINIFPSLPHIFREPEKGSATQTPFV
jgi:hypothetical protein